MNFLLFTVFLACAIMYIQAAPRPQADQGAPKKPSVPGVSINTGFDEIVVESSLNVRNKNPDKRQSKMPKLVIPHMIPKKFGEGTNSKLTTDATELMERTSPSKPSKPSKKTIVSTTSTTERTETTTE